MRPQPFFVTMHAMLPRLLEPEIMDTAEDAADYDAMNHAAVNGAFCTDFLGVVGSSPLERVLDVGTGTALIPIELCKRRPALSVVALDLAEHMLNRARENVARAGLHGRIVLELRDAKESALPPGSFDAVVSNSIVHHIPSPGGAVAEMWRLVAPGGTLFIRDLFRPETEEALGHLVETYAPRGDERTNRQRALFEASLRAALTEADVEAIAKVARIEGALLQLTSDRHWTLSAKRSPT
ncbi:MAG: methyltransferase domain-containing protein [Polyangiaceae bacterium]